MSKKIALDEKKVSIPQFIRAINLLPSDEPKESPRVWYKTQKEHWLGWLGGYNGPGFYKRKNWKRDARFAYNHVVCPELLMYLIRAIPLKPELVEFAEQAYQTGTTLMEKAGAIRKVVPWLEIYQVLWGKEETSFLEKIGIRKSQKHHPH